MRSYAALVKSWLALKSSMLQVDWPLPGDFTTVSHASCTFELPDLHPDTGWLVLAHALLIIGDSPHAASAGGSAESCAEGRPNRLPHL